MIAFAVSVVFQDLFLLYLFHTVFVLIYPLYL